MKIAAQYQAKGGAHDPTSQLAGFINGAGSVGAILEGPLIGLIAAQFNCEHMHSVCALPMGTFFGPSVPSDMAVLSGHSALTPPMRCRECRLPLHHLEFNSVFCCDFPCLPRFQWLVMHAWGQFCPPPCAWGLVPPFPCAGGLICPPPRLAVHGATAGWRQPQVSSHMCMRTGRRVLCTCARVCARQFCGFLRRPVSCAGTYGGADNKVRAKAGSVHCLSPMLRHMVGTSGRKPPRRRRFQAGMVC